jgi:hypothetical protein
VKKHLNPTKILYLSLLNAEQSNKIPMADLSADSLEQLLIKIFFKQ